MRITGRERGLIAVVVVLAMAAAFYFFAYSPLTTQRTQLQATLTQRQARLKQMQEIAAQRVALEQEYATRQQRIEAIEAKLPPEREIPTLLRQMQAVAAESGVKLTLLRPGPTEAPPSAQAPPAAQPPAPAQPAAQAQPYRQFRVELGFEGSYDKVVTFLRRLENFPRFIAMTQFTLTAQELPQLRLSVTTTTFVLPESVR